MHDVDSDIQLKNESESKLRFHDFLTCGHTNGDIGRPPPFERWLHNTTKSEHMNGYWEEDLRCFFSQNLSWGKTLAPVGMTLP